MKNFKKIIAFGSAIAMTMSIGVSAMAETTIDISNVTNDGILTVDKENSTLNVIKATVAAENATTQYTVVVAKAADAQDGLSDSEILYINQGIAGEDFWNKTGMGLKEAMTDAVDTDTSDQPLDEQTPTEYVVRVGGENVSVTKGEKTYSYYEAVISVLTTEDGSTTNTIEVKWGDVTGDDIVDSSDAIAALMNFAGYTETYTVKGNSVVVGSDLGDFKWGDITGDNVVDSSDAIAALMNFAGYTESYTVNGSSITVGAPVTISIE